MGLKVTLRSGERVEPALKKLKRMLLKEGHHRDLARHKYFTSKSERRRMRQRKSAARRMRELAK